LLPKPEAIKQNTARPARQKLTKPELATLAGVALIAVFILVYAWATPAAPTAPATAHPTAIPTAQATAAPTAAPATAVRLLAAFAAPDGSTLGTIEATRAITPVAHFGSDWIQAEVEGSGLIWLRAADLPGTELVGPDLAPRPTARPVAAPASAPAPTQCAEMGIPGKRAVVCGTESLESLQQQAQAEWTRLYGSQYAR
ncbi:MAG TPA: hypothetical protein VFU22_30980, partial [Roseiflexaceae bacterium]|nr:hypothetical protein [Roseiflexaceae bacterium]